jgi:hypothetical protein
MKVDDEGEDVAAAPEPLFYIQDARSVVGNCVLWWRPNGHGYTTELKDAGLYTAAKGRGLRETDVMVPKEIAESLVVTHVRADSMREVLSNLRKKVP